MVTPPLSITAASNLGQMLVKLCRNENVPLVNIVRKSEQVDILKALGAEHIVNSSENDFVEQLVAAIDATGATLAYDATGGGTLADTILGAMERSLSKAASGLNTYGSDTFKQVYLYGGLDLTPTQLKRGYGMSWGIGGWLMPLLLARVGAERAAEMRPCGGIDHHFRQQLYGGDFADRCHFARFYCALFAQENRRKIHHQSAKRRLSDKIACQRPISVVLGAYFAGVCHVA